MNNTLKNACKKIAPLWPLDSFVAVNPYLGLAEQSFENAAQSLHQLGLVQMALPVNFYKEALKKGNLLHEDVEKTLEKEGLSISVDEFIAAPAYDEETNTHQVVMDIASQVTGTDWNAFFIDRITAWASAYFDDGQLFWNTADQKSGIFRSWKANASLDRSPSIMGLKSFRKTIKNLPDDYNTAIKQSLETLKLSESQEEIYAHALMLRVNGWSSYIARLDWEANLYGGYENHLYEFLAVLICQEAALYTALHNAGVSYLWEDARDKMSGDPSISEAVGQKLLWQKAYDHACQRSLIEKINNNRSTTDADQKRPDVQAIFCIDVRSEVYRRNLENQDRNIETLGFAGFFAFPVKYTPLAHEKQINQCPVLIPSGAAVTDSHEESAEHKFIKREKIRRQVSHAWKSFKLGAISCFSFVGPVGLMFLPKLFADAFGINQKSRLNQVSGKIRLEKRESDHVDFGIPVSDQIEMAKTALKAMSLHDNFARIVLITGHGSSTVNNPLASGLDCGACGGQSGEVNARVAAAVLNNPEVREVLVKDIPVPADTIFVAAQHDTTTDEVTIFDSSDIPASHIADLEKLKKNLVKASKATRLERSARMAIKNKDLHKDILNRSKDWSQVRPEWGLAGCNTFIVGPRKYTQNISLDGKSFLHSYDWKQDEGFGVLELIMTAPMVVTSWINLQYYASTVDNKQYGSGNKTLHNITGGIGVLEGNSGDLRQGLPWQSVHDGVNYQHLPQRLNVVIHAPLEAMNEILKKHQNVKDLCDNGWIKLLAFNEEGKIQYRYKKDFKWEHLQKEELIEVSY